LAGVRFALARSFLSDPDSRKLVISGVGQAVNEMSASKDQPRTSSSLVFISYATADRKQALQICKALERRDTPCWIATRDVPPGANYQEAIVGSLRGARAMVLVFSDAANNSDEIKKELSLASRYHIPVMALRIEDVEPSDAFAYELSTRQWIDAFDGWERSLDSLVRQIGEVSGAKAAIAAGSAPDRRRLRTVSQHRLIVATAVIILVIGIAGLVWRWLQPPPAAAHSMMVRLAGFQRLSNDIPATMPDAMRDEIIAAFGDQGVVGASTASAPPPGPAPAYALGGTVRRDGGQIRVITRLFNERSGATLWSDSFDFDADQLARVPRKIAVNAGNMVRCGLYGASTYRKSLPDGVLSDYMQYCQTAGAYQTEVAKGLDSARRVVAAAPDFSWGWSAVAVAAVPNLFAEKTGPAREELRRQALQAADRALALDPTNSEAFAQKSMLIDSREHAAQEQLLKRAVAARPLACGCEHYAYGLMLQNVGRFADSVTEFRRATEMLALDPYSQVSLGDALVVTGKADEAKPHMEAAIDLWRDPGFDDEIALSEATETGDYAAGIRALRNPKLPLSSPAQRSALVAGFQAMESRDEGLKARALDALRALPDDQKDILVMGLFGALGANRDALQAFTKGIGSRYDWLSLLWYPSMRGTLADPAFPALTQRLGLMRYWRTTHTRPDVCKASRAPPFCRMI
jgi:tetratricopeptide (TPR) repeat protein